MKLTPEQRVHQALNGMIEADFELYDRCLLTIGFAYHFNQLAKIARGDYANTAEDEKCVKCFPPFYDCGEHNTEPEDEPDVDMIVYWQGYYDGKDVKNANTAENDVTCCSYCLRAIEDCVCDQIALRKFLEWGRISQSPLLPFADWLQQED